MENAEPAQRHWIRLCQVLRRLLRLAAVRRSIVGLDAGAVRKAFSTFINTPSLNAPQIRFLDLPVQYLSSNGYLETEKLFEAFFTEVSAHGLLGVFNSAQAGEVVSLVELLNQYAEAR